jgi:hypothetical protein
VASFLSNHGILLEDEKAMATRNNMVVLEKKQEANTQILKPV